MKIKNSGDVFFDDSILEVIIDGKRKFSQSISLKRQRSPRNNDQLDGTTNTDADDALEETGEDNRSEETTNDDNSKPRTHQGPSRNIGKVNFALLHRKGKKNCIHIHFCVFFNLCRMCFTNRL